MSGIKRDKRDIVFAKLVKERVNWTCEACGNYFPEGDRQGLHCSHFYSRRSRSTRWSPENAAAHCFSCHQKLGGNPVEFRDWIIAHLGSERAAQLKLDKNATKKFTKPELEDLYQHLKAELKRLEGLRKEGVVGRLEFEAYG